MTYANGTIVQWALILAASAVLLTGCQTRYITLPADPVLARDCDRPMIDPDNVTRRELARGYLERGEALKECTQRMRALRGQAISSETAEGAATPK